jgi:hypothetical protein
MGPATTSPASASMPVRNPLQPLNAQLGNSNTNPPNSAADDKTTVKKEETYLSPYASNENVLTGASSNLDANARTPAPYGPISSPVKSESKDSDFNMTSLPQQGMFFLNLSQSPTLALQINSSSVSLYNANHFSKFRIRCQSTTTDCQQCPTKSRRSCQVIFLRSFIILSPSSSQKLIIE